MPFDRFTVEQIAGDMLPDATAEQKVATGFHRNTMINEEGGIDVEEFRFASLVDRVATTGTVWLGLTIQCAQCHTHKFDPITQREYYQFLAFFDNADEPDLDLPRPKSGPDAPRSRRRSPPWKLAWRARFPAATTSAAWQSPQADLGRLRRGRDPDDPGPTGRSWPPARAAETDTYTVVVRDEAPRDLGDPPRSR